MSFANLVAIPFFHFITTDMHYEDHPGTIFSLTGSDSFNCPYADLTQSSHTKDSVVCFEMFIQDNSQVVEGGTQVVCKYMTTNY